MVMLPAEGQKPMMEKSKIEVKINEHYNLVRRTGLHRAEVLGKLRLHYKEFRNFAEEIRNHFVVGKISKFSCWIRPYLR